MISIQGDAGRFNLRVGAVIFSGNRLLMNKLDYQRGWYLPGGRLEMDESSTDSLVREMREELNVEIAVQRLLWVLEHFFHYRGTPYHEVGLYFLAEIPAGSGLHDYEAEWIEEEAEDSKIVFKWMTQQDLDSESVYPSFIRGVLGSLPNSIEHIVHRDPEEREVS